MQTLTLLEGKWFSKVHVSVHDIFTPLFKVWTQDADASCHYEQFTTKDAFCTSIRHAFKARRASTIYIGAHGYTNGIEGFHGDRINRNAIKKAFNDGKGTTHRGVYFGSCNFGHAETAKFILRNCERVLWFAGYDKPVDWIDSSAIDLVFLQHYLFPRPGKGFDMPKTPTERLEFASKNIVDDMEGLAGRLGFHVFSRLPTGGGIKDLITGEVWRT